MPTGFSHTAAGAEAAALHFLLLAQSLVQMDDGQATHAQRAIAASAASDRLIEELLGKLRNLRAGFPGGLTTYRIGPVASRVAFDGGDRATVDIWYVGVVSPPNLPPYEEWRTARQELVWERGDWRQDAATSTPGPRPVALPRTEPSGPGQLEAALVGFGPVGAAG